ncbi:hypothetical protein CRUP_018423 [Coryphaenoides rupestris]|nr:hypothetical protein CRUP_018423 [Coryphaenoides rupestris]
MREYKVVVLGSGGVGKSALTVQFVTGTFIEKYDPTIEDFYRKEIEVDSSPSVLEILDTAGTEQFASMRDLYIKNGQGFILVYSLVNQQSFQDIKPMRDQIIRVKRSVSRSIVSYCDVHACCGVQAVQMGYEGRVLNCLGGGRYEKVPVIWWATRYEKVPVILVGNKVDLESEREVSAGEGQALAEEWGCPFMETSAKSKTMVDELFAEIWCLERGNGAWDDQLTGLRATSRPAEGPPDDRLKGLPADRPNGPQSTGLRGHKPTGL